MLFLLISLAKISCDPHLKRLVETVQMRITNMFLCRINKYYP